MTRSDNRQCRHTGKVGYRSEGRAWSVAVDMFKRHGSLLWAFRCTTCGLWHLGTPRNPYFIWLLKEASKSWHEQPDRTETERSRSKPTPSPPPV